MRYSQITNININLKEEAGESSVSCTVCNIKDVNSETLLNGPPMDRSLVKCAECLQHFHANCIEMPGMMVNLVRKYNWTCIECRTCSVCHKPDQEVI